MAMKKHTRLDLVEGGNIFKQGDYVTLGFIPRDYTGASVDLTNKQIEGSIFNGSTGVIYEGPASFVDGKIFFTIKQVLNDGKFQLEFTVTDAADPEYRTKFPTDDYASELTIKPSADNLDYVGVSMTTVAQLRTEQEQKQQQFELAIVPQVDELKQRVEEGIGAFTEDTEVKDARMDEINLRTFNQKVVAQLADTATKTEVDNKVAKIVSGSPKGTYATLADLQAAKPTGDTGVYVISDSGNWFYWSGADWLSGGIYQASGGGKTLSTVNNVGNPNLTTPAGWSSLNGGTLSVANNVGTFTAIGQYGRFKNAAFSPIVGHVYYAKARVKATSPLVGLGNNLYVSKAHSGSGNFETLDFMWTVTSTTKELTIVDGRASGRDAISFEKVVAINLTETFKGTPIPPIEEIRQLFSKFTNDFFEGSVQQFVTFEELYSKTAGTLTKRVDVVEKVAAIDLKDNEIARGQAASLNIPAAVITTEPLNYRVKGETTRSDTTKTVTHSLVNSLSTTTQNGTSVVNTVAPPSPVELKGISGDVRDELFSSGTIRRKVGKIQFDGTEPWEIPSGNISGYKMFRYTGLYNNAMPPFKSSHFPYDDVNYSNLHVPLGSSVRKFQKSGQIFLILKNELNITTVADLQSFLSAENAAGRPFTVFYQKGQWNGELQDWLPTYTEEKITIGTLPVVQYGKLNVSASSGTPVLTIHQRGNVIPEYPAYKELRELSLIDSLPKINEVAKRVKEKQNFDTFTFGFVTDTHTEAETLLSMALIAEAAKSAPMKYICHGGDIIDGFDPKPVELDRITRAFHKANSATVPFYYVFGNHDDNNWYARTREGSNQLSDYISPLEIYTHTMKFFEDKVTVGSREGLYYYVDDEHTKIRSIFVNTHKLPFEANPDGTAKFNAHDHDAFGDEQLNWIANTALKFNDKDNPSEWASLFIGHVVGNSMVLDNTPFIGILNAYKTGTSYTRTGTTTVGDYSVTTDFTQQGAGDLIALFNGDMHMDTIYTLNNNRMIVTLNANARPETCWDVFTIDRSSRTIYATRYGTGVDRVTTY